MTGHSLNRRDAMKRFAAAYVGAPMVLTGVTAASAGANDDDAYYTPPGFSRTLPAEAGALPRAAFGPTGPFDLSEARQRKLARLKTLNALGGEKTYFYSLSRHTLCPPGRSPYPFFAELELTTMWIERRPGMSDTQGVIRAIFTRTPIDPLTYEPISSYANAYLGRRVDVKDTLFAGGGFEIDLADQGADPILPSDEPPYEKGAQTGFIMFDPRSGDGAYQPRIDTVVWRVRTRDLMDPEVSLLPADYTYSSIMKASVYPWSAIEDGDAAQMLTQKVGAKVTDVADLPAQIRQSVVQRHPDRV